jgi:hypothetical protein
MAIESTKHRYEQRYSEQYMGCSADIASTLLTPSNPDE